MLLAVLSAELFCRLWLGLGDPVLYSPHPTIEYLMQPSRTHHRFGNRIAINAWSMRSAEFPDAKANPAEFRVLVLGDSIVNGGAYTDQAELATEILQESLRSALGRPVVVGNASAGSWGPPNMLAYVREFGFFDADCVIVVVGSEDYGDVPTFAPLGPELPQRSPILALQEAVTRYLPQLLRYRGMNPAPPIEAPASDVRTSLDALNELLDESLLSGARVLLALHPERTELMDRHYKVGGNTLLSVGRQRGVDTLELSGAMNVPLAQQIEPYRDWVHPNAHGQAAIAEALGKWVLSDQPRHSTQP